MQFKLVTAAVLCIIAATATALPTDTVSSVETQGLDTTSLDPTIAAITEGDATMNAINAVKAKALNFPLGDPQLFSPQLSPRGRYPKGHPSGRAKKEFRKACCVEWTEGCEMYVKAFDVDKEWELKHRC